MNILLVYPPLQAYTSYWTMHLGLGYLAAVLREQGHRVTVVDCVALKLDPAGLTRHLAGASFDLVGITATTSEIHSAHAAAQAVKKSCPGGLVVIGGPHCSTLAARTLQEFPAFDVAVAGEGEDTILEIVDCLEEAIPFETVRGIAHRGKGGVLETEPRDPIADLNRLPFPAWELFSRHQYTGFLGIRKKVEFPITSGRGCPHRCVFCQHFLGRQVRLRDPTRVVDEMERDIELGAESLHFCDETFTMQRGRTLAMCEDMIARGIPNRVEWHCETRVDVVDLTLLKKMRQAGCVMVNLGAESGNEQILKNTKKGITVGQIEDAFRWSKRAGLLTYMNLIFGHPGETEATVSDSIELLMRVNPDYVTIGIMTPFPGTELLQMALKGEMGLRLSGGNWDGYARQNSSVLSVNDLTNSDLKRLQAHAYRRFYGRPSRVLRLFELAKVRHVVGMAWNRLIRK